MGASPPPPGSRQPAAGASVPSAAPARYADAAAPAVRGTGSPRLGAQRQDHLLARPRSLLLPAPQPSALRSASSQPLQPTHRHAAVDIEATSVVETHLSRLPGRCFLAHQQRPPTPPAGRPAPFTAMVVASAAPDDRRQPRVPTTRCRQRQPPPWPL